MVVLENIACLGSIDSLLLIIKTMIGLILRFQSPFKLDVVLGLTS